MTDEQFAELMIEIKAIWWVIFLGFLSLFAIIIIILL